MNYLTLGKQPSINQTHNKESREAHQVQKTRTILHYTVIKKCYEHFSEKPAMPSNVLSLIQLRTMPLADQVKTLLTNGKYTCFIT